MAKQVQPLQSLPSPDHETLDHRPGIPTTLLGDGLEHAPGLSSCRAALNREQQRKIIAAMEGTIDPHRPLSAGGWAGRFGEMAREVGLDLLPPAARLVHFSDNGTVSSHLLKRLAAWREAVAFLDEAASQVYKIYNVRSRTMGAMGWGGEASANLFDWGAMPPPWRRPNRREARRFPLPPLPATGWV